MGTVTLAVTGNADKRQLENVVQDALSTQAPEPDVSTAAPYEVLLVQAVSPQGFWRAGQFWPHAGVHVFVDAELEGDILPPYLSTAVAERLKAEPHLRVTVLDELPPGNKGA